MELKRVGEVTAEILDANNFVGTGNLKRMLLEPDVKVYRVTFEAGARTNWHTHSGIQLLMIIEGCCWFQKRGESKQKAHVGDVVMIAPNEDHWHGASDDAGMVHVAVNLAGTTSWNEPVSDGDYAS